MVFDNQGHFNYNTGFKNFITDEEVIDKIFETNNPSIKLGAPSSIFSSIITSDNGICFGLGDSLIFTITIKFKNGIILWVK